MIRKTTAREIELMSLESEARVRRVQQWVEEEMRRAAQAFHDDRYREFWEACQPPKPGWFRRTFLGE